MKLNALSTRLCRNIFKEKYRLSESDNQDSIIDLNKFFEDEESSRTQSFMNSKEKLPISALFKFSKLIVVEVFNFLQKIISDRRLKTWKN